MELHLQSWASLVNKEALQGIPSDERKRQEVRPLPLPLLKDHLLKTLDSIITYITNPRLSLS